METLDHMGELFMGSFLLMHTLHLNELNALEIIFDCRMSMFSATILLISFLQMTVLLKREMTNSCVQLSNGKTARSQNLFMFQNFQLLQTRTTKFSCQFWQLIKISLLVSLSQASKRTAKKKHQT